MVEEIREISKEMNEGVFGCADKVNNDCVKSTDVSDKKMAYSYAKVAMDNKVMNNKLWSILTEILEDEREVVIFDEELVTLGSEKWNLIVCRYFVGYKMSVGELRYNLRRMWSKNGVGDIVPHNNDVFLFKFHHKEGLQYVLKNRPWLITNKPMFVQKWDPEMYMYRNANFEVKGSKFVNVEYMWKPDLCQLCSVFGHENGKCKHSNENGSDAEKNNSRKGNREGTKGANRRFNNVKNMMNGINNAVRSKRQYNNVNT
uniref:Reverse transcriptase domain, reverse transcriptase zinc-binding domain protein n=1 Tax=Tanacetum cinerariifolium TaxID=118510 RepID=A0A699IKK4_TANCI|nr:reverse transcriptase domain, reverse transcriptase zinc-binding domain protein [Tanacetum cinerariifolium]